MRDDQLKQSFFKIAKEADDVKLKWLNSALAYLISDNNARVTIQMEHLRAYANANSVYSINESADQYLQKVMSRDVSKVRHPHIHDITEVKVSQMTRLKSDIIVKPKHSEYDDRGTARVAHLVINNIFDVNEFDDQMISYHRFKYIFGEIYADIDWDEDAGDFDELYEEARRLKIDDITLTTGKKLNLDFPIRKGEVVIKPRMPWAFLFERTRSGHYEDAKYGFTIDYRDRDELEEDYPKLKNVVLGDYDTSSIANAYLKTYYNAMGNEVPVFTFWHKKTKYLPNGRKIVFIPGTIISDEDHPFSHGDFPVERLTDIDIETTPNGVSRYTFCLPIQKRIDDLNLMIDKNIKSFARTKYVTGAGTNIDELADESTNITVPPGGMVPTVLNVNPLPEHLVARVHSLINTLQVLMGNHGVSRGEIPKGITSEDALSYLNELESERSTSEINKHGKFVIRVAKKALSIASDKYKADDNRLENIVGKDNKTFIKNFDVADLSKPYDIAFENSDGFPETIASKRQRINLMFQQNPNMLSGPEWLHFMGLSDDEAVIDSVTDAIQAAESENEDLLNGQPVKPPEDYEDLIVHYRVHVRGMQKRYFKEEAPESVIVAYKKHVYETEEAIIERMQISPTFSSQVATIPFFPIFKHANYQPPMPAEQSIAIAQGNANKGLPSGIAAGKATYHINNEE